MFVRMALVRLGALVLAALPGVFAGCGSSARPPGDTATGGTGNHSATGGGGVTGGGAGLAGTAGASAGASSGGTAGVTSTSAGRGGGAGTATSGAAGMDAAGGGAGAGGRTGGGGNGGAPVGPGKQGTWAEIESPFSGAIPESTAVKLADGTVLLLGFGVQAFRFFPEENAVRPTAVPLRRIADAAASLLEDGRVLVIGGRNEEGRDAVAACDFYDPVADAWAPAPDQPAERSQQSAATLASGDVLVAGGVAPGVGGVPATDVFRFVAASGTWETLAPLANPTRFPSLFLLDDETAMVLAEVPQVYSLPSMSVIASPALSEMRRYATGVALAAGGVLAVGGAPLDALDETSRAFDTVDGFVPGATRFTARTPLGIPRTDAGAVELGDGTVLVSGGIEVFVSTIEDRAALSAERYVPATATWYPEAPPPGPSGRPAVLLDDGSVFFGGGTRFYPEPW